MLLVLDLASLQERCGAHWGQMPFIWEILGKCEMWAKASHSYGKATGKSFQVGLKVGYSLASRNHQGGTNSVSQIDGISDMVPFVQLCAQRLLEGTIVPASTSVWEKTVPPASALMPDNSLPPSMSLVPLKQMPQHWVWGWFTQRVWVWVNLCMGPLRGSPGIPEAFHIPQPQSLLVFRARNCGDFPCWH